MPAPGEHKTVQSRILAYAEAIGWTFVSRDEAEQRRGFDPAVPPADRAKNRSLFFDDLPVRPRRISKKISSADVDRIINLLFARKMISEKKDIISYNF
jgi:hypothetical protein